MDTLRADNARLRRLLQLSEEQARAAASDQATLTGAPASPVTMRITRDAFKALVLFTDAYERQGGAHAEYLRDLYVGTRPRTQKELAALRRPNRKAPRGRLSGHVSA